MLKVKTLVRDSSINGKGLIADEDIPKGTITWEFFSGIDIVLVHPGLSSQPKEILIPGLIPGLSKGPVLPGEPI